MDRKSVAAMRRMDDSIRRDRRDRFDSYRATSRISAGNCRPIADRSPTDRRPARKPSVRRIDRAARASRLSGAPSPNPFERARFDAGASSPRAAAHPRWRMSAVGVEPKSSLST
ncbi:hypothetical protein ADU20_25900 [Burkholderia pseudomallei]|nr:hypothetical protein AM256_18940 [Burkholderia pseudomallei]ALC01846.1 hypothetical protein AM257_18970 [Burkholderia pseudomallei]KNA31267.1 hypothetical protein ADU20_25900 [Burkholderia pseudomallei]